MAERGPWRALAIGLFAWVAATAACALQVTDDRGAVITLDRPPLRIVSLLPSLTETVCALGQCRRLVGIDRDSNYPAAVRSLPRLGGGLEPNVEGIVALRPDVVLMAGSSRAVQRLEALGVKVVTLESRNFADVERAIDKIGHLLDVPDAQRVWRDIEADVAEAARSLRAVSKNLKVYFEVGRGPYAAGQVSFIGETLTRLGVQNIIGREMGPFPKVNPEYVVRADPDLIMISQNSAPGLEQRPGWSGMRALRERRVCIFTTEQSDALVRAGPRLAQAARLMAECIAAKGAPDHR